MFQQKAVLKFLWQGSSESPEEMCEPFTFRWSGAEPCAPSLPRCSWRRWKERPNSTWRPRPVPNDARCPMMPNVEVFTTNITTNITILYNIIHHYTIFATMLVRWVQSQHFLQCASPFRVTSIVHDHLDRLWRMEPLHHGCDLVGRHHSFVTNGSGRPGISCVVSGCWTFTEWAQRPASNIWSLQRLQWFSMEAHQSKTCARTG